MTLPAGINSTWFASRVVPAGVYKQALLLHEREEFAQSSACLEPFLRESHQSPLGQTGVSLGRALVVHAWNLFHGMQLDELADLLLSLDDSTRAEFPELQVVECALATQSDRLTEALDLSADYIRRHLDPIPAHLFGFLFVNGMAANRLGMVDRALESLERAHSLASLVGDEYWSGLAANYLGFVHMQASSYRDALRWLDRARVVFQQRGLTRKMSMVSLNSGITCYKLAEYTQAHGHLEAALKLGKAAGVVRSQCFANIALGNAFRLTRDFETARRHLHTGYNQAQELQFSREEALSLEFLGDVYRDEGQTEAARRFYARAMAIASKIAPDGDVVMELRRRNGECFCLENRPADAMPELQRALHLSRAQKDRFEEGVTLRVMSEVAYRSHDLVGARRLIDKSSSVLQEIGARHEAVIALLHSVDICLGELDAGRCAIPTHAVLDQAWRQATTALDLAIRIDVRWWTDRCRATVARVSAMRAAAGRTTTKPGSPSAYAPGDVVVHAGSAMRDLLQLCDMFASCPDPVLITGETGTGKEVLARRLHRHGSRADRPLVVVNVAAIPHTMFEREFFGHTRGAFSGAERDSTGFAAQADGGTLFLDEIGELPLEVQPKLLRLLQEGTYQAIGDPKPRSVDIRLIAATNANLRQMVADGRFRADLYYRLQTLELDILPLRERPEDVLPLLRHFLSLAAERQVDLAEYFNRRSLAELSRHDWPGNAREVAIVARRAHLGLSTRGSVQVAVPRADGPSFLAEGPHDTPVPPPPAPAGLTAEETAERTRILLAIEESGGSRLHAARTLGMGRSTLYRKLTQLGIATRRD